MSTQTESRLARTGEIQWVPLERMRVSPPCQRDLRKQFVDYLQSEFDPDEIGYPIVSLRDGWYYIIDGQHRVAALREMGWGDQQIECEVREGLDEADEAEMFLRRNDRLNVSPGDKFRVAITAGREAETEIAAVCEKHGYRVVSTKAFSNTDFNLANLTCYATLRKLYDEGGAELLDTVLGFVNKAFVQEQTGSIIAGLGLVVIRYGDVLDVDTSAERLGRARGGSRGLLQRAEGIKRATGKPKAQCVAAAAVDTINSGRGGRKLPNWFTV